MKKTLDIIRKTGGRRVADRRTRRDERRKNEHGWTDTTDTNMRGGTDEDGRVCWRTDAGWWSYLHTPRRDRACVERIMLVIRYFGAFGFEYFEGVHFIWENLLEDRYKARCKKKKNKKKHEKRKKRTAQLTTKAEKKSIEAEGVHHRPGRRT